MPASVRIAGLSKTYRSRLGDEAVALAPLDAEIAAGEFVALVGPTGCGKSTLLKMLAGVLPPTSGGALIDDAPIHGPSLDRSVVFQNYALFPWLTALGNVEFGLVSQGVPKEERRSIALEF